MLIFKNRIRTITERYPCCGYCGAELRLKTITAYRSSDKDDPGISFEYLCPRCKNSCFLDKEYPRIVEDKK